jgi:hypothetical protein
MKHSSLSSTSDGVGASAIPCAFSWRVSVGTVALPTEGSGGVIAGRTGGFLLVDLEDWEGRAEMDGVIEVSKAFRRDISGADRTDRVQDGTTRCERNGLRLLKMSQ